MVKRKALWQIPDVFTIHRRGPLRPIFINHMFDSDANSASPSDRERDSSDLLDSGSGSGSEEGSGHYEEPVGDNWGPKTAPKKVSKQMTSFLKRHQRVDTKLVTCVLSKEMLSTYFSTV